MPKAISCSICTTVSQATCKPGKAEIIPPKTAAFVANFGGIASDQPTQSDQTSMETEEEVEIDAELAELLQPSTYCIATYRAQTRAARSKRELQLILDGEKLVMEARAARLKEQQHASPVHQTGSKDVKPLATDAPTTSIQPGPHQWTAKEKAQIKKGKLAAQQMRIAAAMRKSLRDSWSKSSVASEASFSFGNIARSTSMSSQHLLFKLDFSTLRSQQERYDKALAESARTTSSSVDLSVIS